MTTYAQCRLCGESISEHAPGCPHVVLQSLLDRQKSIECPRCKGSVDVNSSDFYECRECNTQFSRTKMAPNATHERIILLDMKNDEPIPVLVMSVKGQGKMRWDKEIEQAKKSIRDALGEESDE